jgi:hypothetical protein
MAEESKTYDGVLNNGQKEEWLRLCELASREENPVKLLELTERISQLLEERKTGLKRDLGTRLDDSEPDQH